MKSISQILKPLFTPKLTERQMTTATPAPETESITLEESPPLARSTKAARDFFKNRPYIEQAVVIEQVGKTDVDVSIFDRALGRRITVRVPTIDRMEADALELARRFSNSKTEIVRC
jgi:hypothetical protein